MKKSDLIVVLLKKHNHLNYREVEALVNTVFEEMSSALLNSERIELRGFGSFSIRNREARVARNPRTGEKVKVSSKKMPYFRAGKNLGKFLNN
jgi:integration host factor subunit beta